MLQLWLQSCSQPWRVLFLERQPRLRHFESHRVRDSWAEASWTQNEDDWIWGRLCSPGAIVCTNHDVFTLWGLHVYLRNPKKRAMRLSLHTPADQLPHNKVEKLVIALDWATCNRLSLSSWTPPIQTCQNTLIYTSTLVIQNKHL